MTKQAIANRIFILAAEMENIAAEMDYYGRFDAEWKRHAEELHNASLTAETWANGMIEDQS